MSWLVLTLLSAITIAVVAGYVFGRTRRGVRINLDLGGLPLPEVLGRRLPQSAAITDDPPPETDEVPNVAPLSLREGSSDADDNEGTAAAEARALDELLLELSHRTKNQLSTILGIITRLRRAHPEAKDFSDNLTARLHGIAACQDVLVDWKWKSPDIEDVSRAILSRHFRKVGIGFAGSGNIEAGRVRIDTASVQNFGLVLNEIAHSAIENTVGADLVHLFVRGEDATRPGTVSADVAGPASLVVSVAIPLDTAALDPQGAPPGCGEFAEILARQAFGAPVVAKFADGSLVYEVRLPDTCWRLARPGDRTPA